MRSLVILSLMAALLVLPVKADEITIAAAADLRYALKDLAAAFEKQTGDKVTLLFGASGSLFSQIKSGAPFDVFLSADLEYPQQLAAAGLADRDSIKTYAIGHLVLWVPKGSHLDPKSLKMDLLTQPDVRRIAIANPRHAPYGRAAMAALQYFHLNDKVADKLVFGENIAQAAQFVQSGNAQAGLLAQSLAESPPMKDAGHFWELPTDAYPELRQGIAIVARSKHKAAARAFAEYLMSAQGRAILEQYGFGVPGSQ